MKTFHDRKHPVGCCYADWSNFLPIMEAYEARKSSYFGTPAVNHVIALNISLAHILEAGMHQRFKRHELIGRAVRRAVATLGAVEAGLCRAGYSFDLGAGVAAAQAVLCG